MFGTIRKHQTGLWIVVGGLTIVSFAILGPTNARMGNVFSVGRVNYGSVGGHPITQDQIRNAVREVDLDYFLKNQQWPQDNIDVNREAYFRIFLVQKMKDMGIKVSDEAAATLAQRMLGGASLDEFADKILKPVGMDTADFDRFLRHSLGIQQLAMTAGVSGRLVTPQEAETMYRLENQDIQTSLVYFSGTNFLSRVPVVKEAVAEFYTNQIANYRIPDQVAVDYIKFNVTNYLAAAEKKMTNLDANVAATMDQLGTNLVRGAKTPEESKTLVRAELIRRQALGDAQHAAYDFANDLDKLTNHTLEDFSAFAASKNMTVRTTQPFDREYGSPELLGASTLGAKAFGLSDDDRFGGPVEAPDGFYIIAFRHRYPAETPTLAQIESKVTADYRALNAIQMAQEEAVKFDAMLTNGLAAGKSFSSICASAGVKPVELPPFSLSIRALPAILEDKISLSLLKQAAFGTPVGKVSPVAGSRDGAFMIYVEKRLPVDEAKLKTEMPQFLTYVRTVRENDAFNQWFNTEIKQDPDFVAYIQRMMEEAQTKTGGSSRRKS